MRILIIACVLVLTSACSRPGVVDPNACTLGAPDVCLKEARGLLDETPSQARTYYGQACDAGVAAACDELARFLEHPLGDVIDHEAALARSQQGCALGSQAACVRTGRRIRAGRGVARDLDEATRIFHEACSLGVDEACGELHDTLEMQGLHEESRGAMRAACDDGVPSACAKWGYSEWRRPGGAPQGWQTAFDACEAHPESMACETLSLFLGGSRLIASQQQATEELLRRCDPARPASCRAVILNASQPDEDSLELAREWCESSPSGCIVYGWTLAQSQDKVRGQQILEAECFKGDAAGCANGYLEAELPALWLWQGCLAGAGDSCHMLGMMLINGRTNPAKRVDRAKARRMTAMHVSTQGHGLSLLETACRQLHAKACKDLARLTHTLASDRQDEVLELYTDACAQSVAVCGAAVESGFAGDLATGCEWITSTGDRACNAGSATACVNLAANFMGEWNSPPSKAGCEQDLARAADYMERGCNLGYEPGCELVDWLQELHTQQP